MPTTRVARSASVQSRCAGSFTTHLVRRHCPTSGWTRRVDPRVWNQFIPTEGTTADSCSYVHLSTPHVCHLRRDPIQCDLHPLFSVFWALQCSQVLNGHCSCPVAYHNMRRC